MESLVALLIIAIAFAIMLGFGPRLWRIFSKGCKRAVTGVFVFIILVLILSLFIMRLFAGVDGWWRGVTGRPPANDVPSNLPNPAVTYTVST